MVAAHYLYARRSFFSSGLLGGASDAAHDFEVFMSLFESGVLLPLPRGVHSFVSDVRLLSVLQGS